MGESFWKFNTGRWPEMATFVDNFLRRTVGSIVFWDRLTGPFIPEMKNEALEIVDDFKYELPDINLDTFFETLTSIIFMIADGDEASIRQIFKDIRGSKWDETVTSYIEITAEELTRFVIFLSHFLTFFIVLFLVVTSQPWRHISPPMMISSTPSPTDTPSSSTLSRLFCSMTGVNMKYIQPALRILSGGSTTLDTPYSVRSLEDVPVMMIPISLVSNETLTK